MLIWKLIILYMVSMGTIGLIKYFRWTYGPATTEKEIKKQQEYFKKNEDVVSAIYVATGQDKESIRKELRTLMPCVIFFCAWLVPIIFIADKLTPTGGNNE